MLLTLGPLLRSRYGLAINVGPICRAHHRNTQSDKFFLSNALADRLGDGRRRRRRERQATGAAAGLFKIFGSSVRLTIGCSHPPPTSPFGHRLEESGEGVAGDAVLASNGDLGHPSMIYMVSESSLMLQFFPCPVSTHVKFALDFGYVRLQLLLFGIFSNEQTK